MTCPTVQSETVDGQASVESHQELMDIDETPGARIIPIEKICPYNIANFPAPEDDVTLGPLHTASTNNDCMYPVRLIISKPF